MTKSKELPSKAQVVVIGGGIIGCSIAYHLAKRGMSDVVLLERQQLTGGTTWHAQGLVSMLWPTPYLTSLAKYSHELYAALEEETGQATGYRRIGSQPRTLCGPGRGDRAGHGLPAHRQPLFGPHARAPGRVAPDLLYGQCLWG